MIHVMKYTLIENLRSKIYLSAIGLLFLILGLSWMGSMINYNFGDFYLTILAFGMNLTGLLVIAISLFLPSANMAMEYERGTAQVLWAKLGNRGSYYLGKYFAFLVLIFLLILMAAVFIGLLAFIQGAKIKQVWLLSYFIFGQFLEASSILSLVFVLYALLRSSSLASLLSMLIIYFSIFVDTARDVALESANSFAKCFYGIIYFAMPKLGYFNFENQIIYQKTVSIPYLIHASLYGIILAGVLLAISNLILEKREI